MAGISALSPSVLPARAGPVRGKGGASADGGERTAPPGTPAAEKNLTKDQQQQVEELKRVDAQVRQHEQAHKSAGGSLAGAIRLQYTTGPDGKRYATSGDVSIDTSSVEGDPAATIAKLEQVKQAALAPGDPSPQDRAVAAQADAQIAQARTEQAQAGQPGGAIGDGAAPGAAAPGAGNSAAAGKGGNSGTGDGSAREGPARDGQGGGALRRAGALAAYGQAAALGGAAAFGGSAAGSRSGQGISLVA